MCTMDEDDRKKKRKKSKYKEYTMGDVDKTVSKAMKQVEQAMKQVKMATSKVPKGADAGIKILKDDSEPSDAKVINVSNKSSTTIHISNSKNVQVGNNNVMVINQRINPRRGKSKNDSSDEENIDEPIRPLQINLTMEREMNMVLESDREVTDRDLQIAVKHIGRSWRRVARSLELTDTDTERIYADYGDNGIREVAFNCLLLWKRRKGSEATVGKLAHAVKKVDESMYCLKELTP